MIQVDFRDFTDDSSRRFDYICNTYATCWGTDFKVRANNEECQLKVKLWILSIRLRYMFRGLEQIKMVAE